MSDTTTPQNDIIAQYLAQLAPRQQSYAPPAPVDRSVASLLGEAVGGGTTGLAPADRESAGTRALLNFGLNMLSASGPSTMPRSFGQVFAQGAGGAEQSLAGSEAVGASRLAAQQAYEEKQQELTISRIKEAIPLLQIMQTQQVQKGLLGEGNKPSTSIAAAGSDGSYEGDVGTLEGTGKSATSTAAGRGQFIEPTWQGFVAANPDLFKGMTPEQILAARNTPEIANKAITWLAQQNAPALAKAGVTPSGPSLALAHRLGPAAAAAVMQSPDNAPVADVLVASLGKDTAAAYIKANPELGMATAGDLKKKYAGVHAPGFLAPGAPASVPTATAPPAAPAGPPAVSPPTVATGGEAAGPGGLATRNARMTTVSPAAQTDADIIAKGMVGAGADSTTLAPPGIPPAPVQTAGPGAPTGGTTAPPSVEQPPAPARVPDVFTPQPVTLPDYIQNRIDHPESDPAIERAFRKEVGSAVGPDAGKLMNQAVANQATAIAKVKADAITEAAAYRKDTVAQQMENWKVLRAAQEARDTAAAKAQTDAAAASLADRRVGINKLRETAVADDTAQLKTMRTNADNSEGLMKELQILRSIERQMPETGSVLFRDYPGLMESFVSKLGMNKDEIAGLDARVLFQNRLNNLALEMSQKAAVGAGTARGVEIHNNMEALPSQATDHMGRLRLMGFINNMAQDTVNRANEAEDYYYTHDHPNKDLELHQSLYKFPQFYNDNHPSVIPRAPSGMTNKELAAWIQKNNVKPGMVYEAPIYKTDPLTGPIKNPRTGKPVVDHYEIQPREDDE